MSLLAKRPGMAILSLCMIYYMPNMHVEIFPRDLISRLAMRDNAVCAWVTNARLLLKRVAHAILMLRVQTTRRHLGHLSTVKIYGTMLCKHS